MNDVIEKNESESFLAELREIRRSLQSLIQNRESYQIKIITDGYPDEANFVGEWTGYIHFCSLIIETIEILHGREHNLALVALEEDTVCNSRIKRVFEEGEWGEVWPVALVITKGAQALKQ